jgi:hypothetical protein
MTNKPRMMSLQAALWLLERVHTRDDDLTGFTVQRVPVVENQGISPSDYLEAWAVVRDYLRTTVDPMSALVTLVEAEGYRILVDAISGKPTKLECIGEDFGQARLTNHPGGGWILAHPDFPARWLKPDGTVEAIEPKESGQ